MDIERNNRLYARLRIALPIMMAIVYPYFCVAATVFLPGPGHRPVPAHWVGIDYLTIPMLLTPIIWLLFCAWSLYFEPGGATNRTLLVVVAACIVAFVMTLYTHFDIHTFPYELSKRRDSLSGGMFAPWFIFLCASIAIYNWPELRNGPSLLVLITSVQMDFLLYPIFDLKMFFPLLLLLPFYFPNILSSDPIPMSANYFIYFLQVLASLLIIFILASSLIMTPLALRLKRLGYRNVPLNALWLLFKKSCTSDLKLVPASQVDHDLMECVRINYAPPPSLPQETLG